MEQRLDTKIQEHIRERRWSALREEVNGLTAPDLADLLLGLKESERILLFSALPNRKASEVFAALEPNRKDELLSGLTDGETRQLLSDLPPDERTQLFEELPGQVTQRLLNLLTPEDLIEARRLLGYPEESVGRLMTPEYVAVRPDWTISRALQHIRSKGREVRQINVIYVTDERWHLLDALELEHFILAELDDRVEEIMDQVFITLSPYDDQEQAVRTMERYDLSALPVVDQSGVLLGVVTVDDVFDVAREETTEDFQKSAAVAPLKLSYQSSSISELYTKRIGWLLVLILVNLVSSSIIAAYEEVLAATIALAFFIPLLIDTGGNTGAQSASLMIRALATGDVKLDQWISTVIKEASTGLLLGLTMGLAGWALGIIRGGPSVGMIVGITMFTLVMAANVIGIGLPFLLTRFRLDPAVASSPLITTLVDALGLLIYFSVARVVLTG